ncbi:hypothetical protein TWF696_002412 [Orbilia brochopaga]|uniref:Uncharacterized protein n=1 Tax=Orbilia brochopaga TaxID=3140254 RepID=A0AAV9U4P8_9PEZI
MSAGPAPRCGGATRRPSWLSSKYKERKPPTFPLTFPFFPRRPRPPLSTGGPSSQRPPSPRSSSTIGKRLACFHPQRLPIYQSAVEASLPLFLSGTLASDLCGLSNALKRSQLRHQILAQSPPVTQPDITMPQAVSIGSDPLGHGQPPAQR